MAERIRVCGCTTGPVCIGQCHKRDGCVCHGMFDKLGREPTGAEIAEENERWIARKAANALIPWRPLPQSF